MQWLFSSFSWARLDWRVIPILLALMGISLLVISSMTAEEEVFWTPLVKAQAQWFALGWGVFLLCAAFDYRKLRDWSWILYIGLLASLIGLYFTAPIQHVHRWYRLPGIAMNIQPSEYAKIILAIVLAAFLEKIGRRAPQFFSAVKVGCIVFVPFCLILKQPDLGTAFILVPITLVIGYFAGLHRRSIQITTALVLAFFALILCLFIGIWSHEEMRPVFEKVLKSYQYERLNPNTYHQRAAATAIGIGGWWGNGWRQGQFARRQWLPASHTDSVFAAYGEEFGFLGVIFLLSLFFALIYFSLQVAAVAKDPFGRLLAAGLAMYLAMHVLLNIAMMCALLPISGVPLILITYGGSSILTTMAALGILQSIYIKRFMF